MSGHRYTVQTTLHMVTSLNAIILIVILVTYNVIISRYYLTILVQLEADLFQLIIPSELEMVQRLLALHSQLMLQTDDILRRSGQHFNFYPASHWQLLEYE